MQRDREKDIVADDKDRDNFIERMGGLEKTTNGVKPSFFIYKDYKGDIGANGAAAKYR